MNTVNGLGEEKPCSAYCSALRIGRITCGCVLMGSRFVFTGDEEGTMRVPIHCEL